MGAPAARDLNCGYRRWQSIAVAAPGLDSPAMGGGGTDRPRPRLAGGPAVILVRPQLAVNIGMCARAMANFGLDDLRLVIPRQGWPRTGEYREIAYSAAAGAT